MANEDLVANEDESPAQPIVRKIGVADLRDVLARGYADFDAYPTHLVFPLPDISHRRSHFGQGCGRIRYVAAGLPAHVRIYPDRPLGGDRLVRT